MITRRGTKDGRTTKANNRAANVLQRKKSMTKKEETPEEVGHSPNGKASPPSLPQPTRRSERRMNRQSMQATSCMDVTSGQASTSTTELSQSETDLKDEQTPLLVPNQSNERGRGRGNRGRRPKNQMKEIGPTITNEEHGDSENAAQIPPDPTPSTTISESCDTKETLHGNEDVICTPIVTYCQNTSNSDSTASSDMNVGEDPKIRVEAAIVENEESCNQIVKSMDLYCITNSIKADSTVDNQSPESPPLKDSVATTGDIEFADMEDIEEVDNDSGEDVETNPLDHNLTENLADLDSDSRSKTNEDVMNLNETQNLKLVSDCYSKDLETDNDDMDISDMETEDEVMGEKTTPHENNVPIRDSPLKPKEVYNIESKPPRETNEASPTNAPDWQMLEYNDYIIDCKERDFDNSCMCKTGRCLDLCVNSQAQIECSEDCANPCCENNFFTKKHYRDVEVFNAGPKGHGVRANESIRKGEFIMEYIGEVIGPDKVDKRLNRYQKQGIKHHYMFEAANGVVIDSTRKGNIMRFVNHSCSPNAIAQDWIVRGKPAIGFFSLRRIEPGEEITFNYNFMNNGVPQKCYCGAENCNGTIGKRKGSNAEQAHQVKDSDDESDCDFDSDYDDDDDVDSDTEFENQRNMKKQQRLNDVIDITGSSNPSNYMDELVDILNDRDGCDYALRWKVVELLLTQAKMGDLGFINKFIEVKGLAKLAMWLKRRYTSPKLGGITIKKKIELTAHVISFLQSLPSFMSKSQLTAYKVEDIVREISLEILEAIRGAEKVIIEDTLENTVRLVCGNTGDAFTPIWELHENLIILARTLLSKWNFYGQKFKRIPKKERDPTSEYKYYSSGSSLNDDRKRRDRGYPYDQEQSAKRQCYGNEGTPHYRYPNEFTSHAARNYERHAYRKQETPTAPKVDALTFQRQGNTLAAAFALQKLNSTTSTQNNNKPMMSPAMSERLQVLLPNQGHFGPHIFGPQLADLAAPPPPPPPSQNSATEQQHSSRNHSSMNFKGPSESLSPRKRRSRFEQQPVVNKEHKMEKPGVCLAPKVSRCFKKLKVSPFLEQPEGESLGVVKKELALELVRHFAKKFIEACEEIGIGFDEASVEITQRMWSFDAEYKREREPHGPGVPKDFFSIKVDEHAAKPDQNKTQYLARKMTPAERLCHLNLMAEPPMPSIPEPITAKSEVLVTDRVATSVDATSAELANKPRTPTDPRPPSVIPPPERYWKAIEWPDGKTWYYFNLKTNATRYSPPPPDEIEPADAETNAEAYKNRDQGNTNSSSETVQETTESLNDKKSAHNKNVCHRRQKERKSCHSGATNTPTSQPVIAVQHVSIHDLQPCDVSSSSDQTEIKKKFRTKLQKIFQEYLHPFKKNLGEKQFHHHARTMNKIFTKQHQQEYPDQFHWTPEVHELAKKYAKDYLREHDFKAKDLDSQMLHEPQELHENQEQESV